MSAELIAQIRAAGGIVHRDGNIFFTNAEQFLAAALSTQARASEAEALVWESTTPGYIKFVTDSRYRKFSPAAQKWYRPICQKCASEAEDAARYRTLRSHRGQEHDTFTVTDQFDRVIWGNDLDAAIDATKGEAS